MDMHLTGRFMDAAEAERSGLVSRVVPAKALIEEAMAAAQKIVEKSMLTAMVVKECVNRAMKPPCAKGCCSNAGCSMPVRHRRPEGRHGAFLEKRTPQFRDR
jgi:enoyl-CoA hydratase